LINGQPINLPIAIGTTIIKFTRDKEILNIVPVIGINLKQ